MTSKKPEPKRVPKRKADPGVQRKQTGKTASVTCPHCRYDRPAQDAHCHICGYPFPWMEE